MIRKAVLPFFIVILLWVDASTIAAQSNAGNKGERPYANWLFDINYESFFDNREVQSPYQVSQTIFGTKLAAEGGIRLGDSEVMIGAYGIKNFGENGIAQQNLTFYYHYNNGHFAGAIGSFPRHQLISELPDVFVYDSTRYYTPNLNGALLQYHNRYGYAEVYCNWLSKQSVNQREIFEIVSDGRFVMPAGPLAGWNIQLTHFAKATNAENTYVYDKLMINPYLGTSMRKIGWLDSLSLTAGPLLSLNRDRKDMLWKHPIGFLGDIAFHKWRVALRNRIYVGQSQFSDYKLYGIQLHRGDPYYRSSFYDRVDLTGYLLRKPYIECYLTASFHFTENCFDNSQLIYLRLFIDQKQLQHLFK